MKVTVLFIVVILACLSCAHATTLTAQNLEALCQVEDNIGKIYCDNFEITDIDVSTFSSWHHQTQRSIVELTITSTGLAELNSPDLFKNLTSLRKLHITNHYSLTALDTPGLFDSLASLEELDLSGNNIRSLDSSLFQGLTRLKTLIVRLNRIQKLPADMFEHNDKIEELNMSYNQLEWLPDGIYDSLPNLKVLNMDGNFLTVITSSLFRFNANLHTLSLHDNNLAVVAFRDLFNLKKLDLSGNQLRSVPVFEVFCLRLDELNLCQNVDLQHVSERTCNSVRRIKSEWRYFYSFIESACPTNQLVSSALGVQQPHTGFIITILLAVFTFILSRF